MARPKLKKAPPIRELPAYRADGWINAMTGVNVAGFDKRRAAQMSNKRITEQEAEDIWRADFAVERAIETIPKMMLRNGFDTSITDNAPAEPIEPVATKRGNLRAVPERMDALDESDAKRGMTKKCSELGVVNAFIDAPKWARAYGGSAIWPGVEELGKPWDDRKRLEKKLDLRKLKNIRHLVVLRPYECWPCRWYSDPMELNFGQPSHFYVQRDSASGGGGSEPLVVHESRLIRFYGTVTSRRQMASNNSWGESILNRILEEVIDFHQAFQGASHLISDFAQAVQKIKGLAELMAAGEDEVLVKRASMVAQSRSIARTVYIDSEEEYVRQETPVSGLPELLDRLAKRVAAAAHMPVTLLFGESPAGLNATGETDVRWFYDEVKAERELHLRPRLEQLIKWIFLCAEGPTAGVEPAGWNVAFRPLWEPTQKEIAERNYTQAQADGLYVDKQVLTPEEVAESRFGGDEWSPETKLDEETRDLIQEMHEEMVEEQVKQGQIPMASATAAQGQQVAQAEAAARGQAEMTTNEYKAALTRESAAREAEARARILNMGNAGNGG